MQRVPSVRSGLLPALLLCLVPVVHAQGEAARERALGALHALRDPDHDPVEELVDELLPTARQEPAFLLDILESGRVPVSEERVQALSEVQRELILLAFERVGRARLAPLLEQRGAAPASLAQRCALVRCWGAVGSRSDLRRLLAQARLEEERETPPALADAVRESLQALLERQPTTALALAGTWGQLDSRLLDAVLRAIGSAKASEGTELLLDVLRWDEAAAPTAVAQLSKLPASPDASIRQAVLEELRGLLPRGDATAQHACRALAVWGDLGAVPGLIACLHAEQPAMSASALWSLQSLTGLPLPEDPSRWEHWWKEEQAWLRAQGDVTRAELVSHDAERVEYGLSVAAQHPLFRPTLCEVLPALLVAPNPRIREAAERTAATLPGWTPTP